MSRHVEEPDLSDLPTPLCGFCGGRLEGNEDPCPALDEGVCRP